MSVKGKGTPLIGSNDFVHTVAELKSAILDMYDGLSKRPESAVHIGDIRHSATAPDARPQWTST
jgi:hypothetical protein